MSGTDILRNLREVDYQDALDALTSFSIGTVLSGGYSTFSMDTKFGYEFESGYQFSITTAKGFHSSTLVYNQIYGWGVYKGFGTGFAYGQGVVGAFSGEVTSKGTFDATAVLGFGSAVQMGEVGYHGYLGAFTGGSFSLDKQESFDFSLEATATQPPERMVAPEVSTFGVISPFSDATIGLQIAPTLAITSINTDIAPSSHTSSPTTPPGVAVVASELVAPTGTEIGLTPSQIDREISVVYPESLSPPQPPEPLPSIDLTSRPPFSAVYHDPEVNLSLLNEIRKKSAFFFAVMLLTFVFSQKTFADSNPMQDALLERMTEAGWRNIEIDGCRVRFIYGRVPPCDDGKPQFFEQEFRLQNVRWQDVSEIFSDGTQTTTNYFVTFQPRGRYFQEVINLPNVNAEIRQEFPNSKWPMKLGPETKEISELIYSQIPRSSPYNWRFFHACYGEVPTLEHGLMLIFERETDARLVTDALVSYAGTQSCTMD